MILDIEKFEPWKSDLIALAEQYKDLTIKWIEDKIEKDWDQFTIYRAIAKITIN